MCHYLYVICYICPYTIRTSIVCNYVRFFRAYDLFFVSSTSKQKQLKVTIDYFEEYCNQEWNLSRQTVYERIQIAESMNEQDIVYFNTQYGTYKTYFLTTMTDEQKEQSLNEGVPTEQGYKSYDKATQKEIAEYKRNSEEMERKAKEFEQQLKQRDEEKAQMQTQLEQARKSEQTVINYRT